MAWLLFELLQSYLDSNNEGHEGQMITIFRKEKKTMVCTRTYTISKNHLLLLTELVFNSAFPGLTTRPDEYITRYKLCLLFKKD